MEDGNYRIVDEPRPGALRSWTTNPFWPWLSLSLAGPWLGVPWFIFNAFAIGSPRRWRDTGLALLVPVGVFGCLLAVASTVSALGLPKTSLPYLLLSLRLVRIVLGYALFMSQAPAFEVHNYFGGVSRNGALLAMAGFWMSGRVDQALAGSPLLSLVLT